MSEKNTVSPHTLVLALGNPLRGDDGVGAAVIEHLTRQSLPLGVAVMDGGTPGLELVLLLNGYRRAIIVDAAHMQGCAAGEWRCFHPHEVGLGHSDLQGTLHDVGLAEALALGEALGVLPTDIIIYGIHPESIDWTPGLSASVQAAVPVISASILNELSC